MAAREPKSQSLHDPRLASLIIESATEYAIFTMDFAGTITAWSHGAERVLGYTAAEAAGMNASALFPPTDVAAEAIRQDIAKARAEGWTEDRRWQVRKGGEWFWANGVTSLIRDPGLPGVLKIMRDETRAKLAEEQRVMLLNELNHRIKNMLATVQSIAEQTLRAEAVEPSAREVLAHRLVALAEAHDVLMAENWAGADLRTIVTTALCAHRHGKEPRIALDGPPIRLSPNQAVTVTLALHELATNAIKYGALKSQSGRVQLTWTLSHDTADERYMTLLWAENGGPTVAPPARKGFGSRLIERLFNEHVGGRAHFEYRPEGLRCDLELRLSATESVPILDLRVVAEAGD